ncbi:MAG TPA: hypothetical protein VLL48_12620 [Longimicrobiales bacterium]|nr:hypothetical protein [Longimicrobiales bacterium]
MVDDSPGVPEALPRVLRSVARRLGPETLDRVWIFPPMRKGRKEWGLVAVSRFDDGPAEAPRNETDRDRRRLYTAAYTAERTGRGLTVEPVLAEEGRAPLDRLPRVMEGVVRRSGDDRGEAREVRLEGDPDRFDALVDELDALAPQEPGSILDP